MARTDGTKAAHEKVVKVSKLQKAPKPKTKKAAKVVKVKKDAEKVRLPASAQNLAHVARQPTAANAQTTSAEAAKRAATSNLLELHSLLVTQGVDSNKSANLLNAAVLAESVATEATWSALEGMTLLTADGSATVAAVKALLAPAGEEPHFSGELQHIATMVAIAQANSKLNAILVALTGLAREVSELK
ncbi:hypothetical protein M885DRAFT_573751 [Pelagophyceae sp. CCMP2097]|nr:hypothetical protein M885DRAFT_573751 [Pelagophyceae sp. CCMP2097]